MSTINLTRQLVSYTLLLKDKARFFVHNVSIIILTICTFSFKLFIDLLLYFLNKYATSKLKNFML